MFLDRRPSSLRHALCGRAYLNVVVSDIALRPLFSHNKPYNNLTRHWAIYGNGTERRMVDCFLIEIPLVSPMLSALLPNYCLEHISATIQAQSAFAPCSSSIFAHSVCSHCKAASSGLCCNHLSFELTSAPASIKISATFSHPPRTA